MSQIAMFVEPEPVETPEQRERRRYDLLGRAFEHEVAAGEARTDAGRERHEAKAAELVEQAMAIPA